MIEPVGVLESETVPEPVLEGVLVGVPLRDEETVGSAVVEGDRVEAGVWVTEMVPVEVGVPVESPVEEGVCVRELVRVLEGVLVEDPVFELVLEAD